MFPTDDYLAVMTSLRPYHHNVLNILVLTNTSKGSYRYWKKNRISLDNMYVKLLCLDNIYVKLFGFE